MKIEQIKVTGSQGWAVVLASNGHLGTVVVNWDVQSGAPRQGSWVISPADWRGQGSWAWAKRLHAKLEGFDGCGGDVAPYRQVLRQFFA